MSILTFWVGSVRIFFSVFFTQISKMGYQINQEAKNISIWNGVGQHYFIIFRPN